MKKLLSTTALVFALGAPALAQTAPATTAPAADQTTMEGHGNMDPFLSARDASDLYASELIGQNVYAPRAEADAAATTGATGTTGMARTDVTAADLDNMDNIGQINEIVLSNEGEVRALVIGVGGFLGMGEQDVAVTMEQVSFASDPDDRAEVYVIVNTNADLLRESPAYDRTSMMEGDAAATTAPAATTTATAPAATEGPAGERTPFVAPTMEREGYAVATPEQVTADTLIGMNVYDVNDDTVGDIDDLILDDAGAVSQVIIDFGGFLGIGTSQVAVNYDELTILADTGTMGGTDLRIYIDATAEQIQAQPQYNAAN